MISNVASDRLYKQIVDRLTDAYHDIHTSGNLIDGPYCRSAEEKLKFITKRKHAKITTSATIALMVALIAWNIRNKKVACANYGYVASANQAALLNDIEFFDVDQKGLLNIETQFSQDLVIPVSLYGNSIDYDNLKTGLDTRIIVDAAQSLGTKYKGQPDGSFGDAAIFSFARNKPVPTAGTHGAIVWDDDSMTDKILSASMNGKLSRNGGIVSYGVNATPFELQAAQIDIGLDHMGEWQVKRKQIHKYYSEQFKNLPVKIIEANADCESNYHKFAMLVDKRDQLSEYLNENNITALLHYTDNFANFFGSGKFPNTDMLCSKIITLPNHAWLTDAEIETVSQKVKNFYK